MTLNELVKALNKLLEENKTLGDDYVYFWNGWDMNYSSVDSVDYEFDAIQDDDRVVVLR